MAQLLKKGLLNFFRLLFTTWLEDFLILIGLSIIIFTTYNTFGVTYGNYSIGLILLFFGLMLAKR